MGGLGNLASITGLGAIINYLFDKPWLYEQRLMFPGIIGSVLGYAIGSELQERIQSKTVYWILFIFSLVLAGSLYIYYDHHLIRLTGKPWWYDWVLFPTFIAMNAAAFCAFALRGLKFVGKGSNDAGTAAEGS